MKRMYYGLQGGGTDCRMGGGTVPNVLISAASLWNGKKFKTLHPPKHDSLFLDSGGFSFFYKNGDYPFSAVQLADLQTAISADWVAIRDYPCEPDVTRPLGLNTNEDRIARTVGNAVECFTVAPKAPWVPVIQGYHPHEYLSCIRAYERENLVQPFMAIGSLCVRKSTESAWEVIRTVRDALPGVKLHGFGIDLKFLRDRRITTSLYSADTQAWQWNNRNYGLNHKGVKPASMKDKLENYPYYNAKVLKLLSKQEVPLTRFNEPVQLQGGVK